jgi:glutamate 5-kinase
MRSSCNLNHYRYKRVIIKVGTNVLTDSQGGLDETQLQKLVNQLAELKFNGVQVLLVSSGAVGAGKRMFTSHGHIQNRMVATQVLASIGQMQMIHTYSELFAQQDLLCSQILVTKEDFRDRRHFLNLKNCLETSWSNEIVPIVNENDSVTINTVTFTDNDELAGLLAGMLDAEAVIILTSVEGLYTGPPEEPESQLLGEIHPQDQAWKKYIQSEKSSLGRGGMSTKTQVAQKNAKLGIATHIANGKRENVLLEVLEGKQLGTTFLPDKKQPSRKKWIANTSGFEKGEVEIDQGASRALLEEEAKSLLPVGIVKIEGSFAKGDIVKISCQDQTLGYGLAHYSSRELQRIRGRQNRKPFIRSDYLFLNELGA